MLTRDRASPTFLFLSLCGLFGVFAAVICAPSLMSQVRIDNPSFKIPRNYEKAWNEVIAKIEMGESLESARKKLPKNLVLIGNVPLGGTGREDWVFRIDDYFEFVIGVDVDSKVDTKPRITHKRRWICFPDGRIQEIFSP